MKQCQSMRLPQTRMFPLGREPCSEISGEQGPTQTGIIGSLQDSLPSSPAIRLVTNNQIQPIPGLVQQMNLPEMGTREPLLPTHQTPLPRASLCPAVSRGTPRPECPVLLLLCLPSVPAGCFAAQLHEIPPSSFSGALRNMAASQHGKDHFGRCDGLALRWRSERGAAGAAHVLPLQGVKTGRENRKH